LNNSKGEYIKELKEIKQYINVTIWDFDQRFKTLMERVNFDMNDIQHKKWFIPAFLTPIRLQLTQQKIATLSEVLEIAIKLEASLNGENAVDINQIQT